MTLMLTVEPDVEPVTLVEAKAHLRVTASSDDDLLAGLIRAARQDVERTTGLALIDQHWRAAFDAIPRTNVIMLLRHPVREILSVTVYGTEGEASVVSPADYQADLITRPARLLLLSRPAPTRAMNGIEIDFRAGYGEAGIDVPDLLRRAILLLVAHWYEFRAGYGPDEQPVSYPPQYDRLLRAYRAGRL